MPSFGRRSTQRINSCHPDLQRLFKDVVKEYDCTILCGHRGQEEQTLAFENKKSKVQWPNSKHNSTPSMAVDLVPYPVDWGNTGTRRERQKAIARFYHFAGFVLAHAKEMGIEVRWGGDWDGDRLFDDQNFDDLPHWELK